MKKIALIGSGLGACMLANELSETFEVTVFEQSIQGNEFSSDIEPKHLAPDAIGGGTKFWHNGLVIPTRSSLKDWIDLTELNKYFIRSFEKLSNEKYNYFLKGKDQFLHENKLAKLSLNLSNNPLFYPKNRYNLWDKFNLSKKVKLVNERISCFELDESSNVYVVNNANRKYSFDIIVSCMGGLRTPLFIQNMFSKKNKLRLEVKDHPTATLGHVKLKKSISKLWNFNSKFINGNFRMPYVFKVDDKEVAFYLRPSIFNFKNSSKKQMQSNLSEYRNNMTNLKLLFKVLSNPSDLMDILSLKLGFNPNLRTYEILMVSEMDKKAINVEKTKTGFIFDRRVIEQSDEFSAYEIALKSFLKCLENELDETYLYPERYSKLGTSAHFYSSINDMVSYEKRSFAKVKNATNLYVCDGSLIKECGFANTGLLIGSLALMLADELKSKYTA